MSDLDFIPEPYRSMIATIEPEDLYIIQKIPASGEPVQIRRIEGSMPASKANEIELRTRATHLSTERVHGRDLRRLFLELARTHGHIIGASVMV